MQIKRHNLFEIGKFLVNVLGVLKPEKVVVVVVAAQTSHRHLLRMSDILQKEGEH